MKKLIIFIFVFLLMGSVSATLLLLHPPTMELNGNVNEKICQKVMVFSDYKGNLIAKIKWANKDSKDLNEYNLNSTSLGIINDFSEKIASNNDEKEVEVCFTFEKSGKYYGALLYNTELGSAGAGIWIYASIQGSNNFDFSSFGKITGNAIVKLNGIVKDNKNQKGLLVSSTTILLFILLILLLFVEKKEREYEKKNTDKQNNLKPKSSKNSKKSKASAK